MDHAQRSRGIITGERYAERLRRRSAGARSEHALDRGLALRERALKPLSPLGDAQRFIAKRASVDVQ
jgi:hypothetical protein